MMIRFNSGGAKSFKSGCVVKILFMEKIDRKKARKTRS
jgi:hypothetical protein